MKTSRIIRSLKPVEIRSSLVTTKSLITRKFSLNAGKAKQLVFNENPLADEKKHDFSVRVQNKVVKKLNQPQYANHLLFMSFATRISTQDETLQNACETHGADKLASIDLGFSAKNLLPGHCLLAFIDDTGQLSTNHTFSLRPNMHGKKLYESTTAPDSRLPTSITKHLTHVYPATHTNVQQELTQWASTAFYTWYVHHPKRPPYSLFCSLIPVSNKEKNAYLAKVETLKTTCQQYSLLDHYHPTTGEQIVSSQNCTSLFKLFVPQTHEHEKLLGNNPTPQLLSKVLNNHVFLSDQDTWAQDSDDELCQPFYRKMAC